MHYVCECQICNTQNLLECEEDPYLIYGEKIELECRVCRKTTLHQRVLTRKQRAELNRVLAERALRRSIVEKCAEYGFECRFIYQSVVITTPIADWCFDYHQSKKTLYHESTIKINFETGRPCKSHCQFRDKRIKTMDVIDYVAAHDKWRAETRK